MNKSSLSCELCGKLGRLTTILLDNELELYVCEKCSYKGISVQIPAKQEVLSSQTKEVKNYTMFSSTFQIPNSAVHNPTDTPNLPWKFRLIVVLFISISLFELLYLYTNSYPITGMLVLLHIFLIGLIYGELLTIYQNSFSSPLFSDRYKILISGILLFFWASGEVILLYPIYIDGLDILNTIIAANSVVLSTTALTRVIVQDSIIRKRTGKPVMQFGADDPIIKKHNRFLLTRLILIFPFLLYLFVSFGFMYTGKICISSCIEFHLIFRVIVGISPFWIVIKTLRAYKTLRRLYITRMKEIFGDDYSRIMYKGGVP